MTGNPNPAPGPMHPVPPNPNAAVRGGLAQEPDTQTYVAPFHRRYPGVQA